MSEGRCRARVGGWGAMVVLGVWLGMSSSALIVRMSLFLVAEAQGAYMMPNTEGSD